MIRLGVDAWNLPGDHRGIGRYLRSILRAWSQHDRDRVEVTLVVPEWHTWSVARRYQREVDRPYRVISRRFVGRARLDALWFPFNGCSWTRFTLPAVATLCDASNFVVPGYAREAQRLFHNAAERCRALITLSRFSQAELARELRIPPERLVPIPLGVAPPLPDRSDPEVDALGNFVLFVGTMERRKGIDVLARAMALVQREHPDLLLVVAGESNAESIAGIDIRAKPLGYVDEQRLAALYRACVLFAFPSRYEGFGLPILEAMSYGAPVVTSNGSALPETGGDAAQYVALDDAPALAAAILRVAEDAAYAEDLRRRGLARAAAMPWSKTARATLEVFECALR
ncbi:MAG TPA: glycosyltransferase family 1 protein [Candidatus Tyrphobacter sp.]